MAVYSIKTVQKIPATLEKAWLFFSRPNNLQAITPSHLGFKILSRHHGDTMYTGQIIEYKIKPVLGIPVYWMTEITHVDNQRFFVDEQRYGPYSMWHHQHHFKEIDGGVEMTDIVHYKIPFSFLGAIANSLFVRKQLEEIFSFRFKKTEEIFGKWPGGQPVDIEF
ncbi:MAG: SRPBCC family protein [Chitinophagaceae bacterium]